MKLDLHSIRLFLELLWFSNLRVGFVGSTISEKYSSTGKFPDSDRQCAVYFNNPDEYALLFMNSN